jgi:hypothetical protein
MTAGPVSAASMGAVLPGSKKRTGASSQGQLRESANVVPETKQAKKNSMCFIE